MAIVGDITPSDGVPKHEKSQREQEELDHMCKLLGGGQRAQEIGQLWMEYEENLSLEAKVVKDFDKVEMILQALEYETVNKNDMENFDGISHKGRAFDLLLHNLFPRGSSRLNWASLGASEIASRRKTKC
ncbi:unnamed protein product [Camellia sinensis]